MAIDAELELKAAIAKYYERADLRVPPDSRFRFYRVQLASGAFRQIKDQIRDVETLRRHLVKMAPIGAWVSAASFLDSQNIGPRDAPEMSRSVILWSQVIVEADYKKLAYAKANTLKLVDWLLSKGHRVENIVFSARRGLHVWTDILIRPDFQNPRDREAYDLMARQQLADELEMAGIKIDRPTLTNTRNIFRISGSLNAKTGLVCRPFTLDELKRDDWLDLVERVPLPQGLINGLAKKNVVAMPRHSGANDEEKFFLSPLAVRKEGTRNPPNPLPLHFVTTSIHGTDGRQVVALRYQVLSDGDDKFSRYKRQAPHYRRVDYEMPAVGPVGGVPYPRTNQKSKSEMLSASAERIAVKLQSLQKECDLSDFYIFKGTEHVWAVALKSVEWERNEKILKASGCDPSFRSMVSRLKYGFFEVGGSPLSVLPSEKVPNGQYSKAHATVLEDMGFQVRWHGDSQIGKMRVTSRVVEMRK